MKKNIISLTATFFLGFILYYFFLPAINIHSFGFWIYVIILTGFYGLCRLISEMDRNGRIAKVLKTDIAISLMIIVIILLIGIINLILSPFFNSKNYSKRITIKENSDFKEDVKPANFNSVPLLDKESSQKLGDRVMGQMPELVSQFYVSELYTQINYKEDIVRVTPLEYNGIVKYFTNKKEGVKGYITVNSVTGKSTLIKLKKGMKYMPSALFNEDLNRTLRFKYPTKIFDEAVFEIDNNGNPYWIVPSIKYVGVGLKKDVLGVVLLNPITGKSKYYETKKVPTWVDHVYSADVILDQVKDWGKYKSGFLNSIFGQKNVVITTDGYNYVVLNDDVYLYTGITSVVSDESNIGFILVNLRTKETKLYSVPGAEENSAMASAEGQVQQMKYKASFPLLINLNNKPTYLISLKDDAGLVKMYAFVDVVDYQKVEVTDSSKGIVKASENYLEATNDPADESTYKTKEIEISFITNAIIDGNTYYYILDTEGKKYKCSVKVSKNKLPFINVTSKISISYSEEKEMTEILKIN